MVLQASRSRTPPPLLLLKLFNAMRKMYISEDSDVEVQHVGPSNSSPTSHSVRAAIASSSLQFDFKRTDRDITPTALHVLLPLERVCFALIQSIPTDARMHR